MQKDTALNSDLTPLPMQTEPHSPRRRDPYLVKSVVHASEILSAFHDDEEALTLKEVVNRCKLPKSMVFRLLYTMERCFIVKKVSHNLYRSTIHPPHAPALNALKSGSENGVSPAAS
jgi:hypothetical protein